VGGAAPPSASAPPVTTASAAPPTSDAAPTTAPPTTTASAPATTIDGAPLPESFQTVARNYPTTAEGNAAFLAAYAARPDIQKLPNGTMYRVLFTGTGKQTPISRFDTVTVSYRGWTIDGKQFDASPVGNPRTFQINALIPGWRDTLLKMKVGDLWEIVIPADQAYGVEGRAGRIAPSQTLVFVVSLAHVAYAG
jgi:FKBP-type peptidyl-prolyl cis-trans isomerase